MDSTMAGRSGGGDGGALVGITAVVLMTALLVSAPVEAPVIDEWTYAWSVEHFLQTGELRVLEWSTVYPLAQILWGALFSRLLGFSFAVLRLSTLVLAWAGLLAFYGTLRELGSCPLLAGYALTGWWLYAHHPTGPPSRGREPDVPWVTGWPILPYKIANVPEPPYAVVRSFRRPMLWAASDTLYVLEHTAVTDHWGLPSLRAREP
jgi:hypothetical protein